MVVVKEESHEEAKRDCDKDPLDGEIPEVNDPRAVDRGIECAGDRKEVETDAADIATSEMSKACPEDRGDWVGVVGKELTDPQTGECGLAEAFEVVDCQGVENGDHARSKSVQNLCVIEVDVEFFHALNDVDGANVQGKGLLGKVGDGAHVVAEVEKRAKPMENPRPDAHPNHELRVNADVMYFDDMEYSFRFCQ